MTRSKFLDKHNIHSSYFNFFTEERVCEVNQILQNIGDDYTPKSKDIFKVFRYDLLQKKFYF